MLFRLPNPPSGPPDPVSTDEQDAEALASHRQRTYYHTFCRNCIDSAEEDLHGGLPPPPPKPRITSRDCPIPSGSVCFEAGTPVLASDGLLPIQLLRDGDSLWAAPAPQLDIGQATLTWAGVTGQTDELIEIVLDGEAISCTANHPFWVQRQGWALASQLQPGDLLQDPGGQSVPVLGVRTTCLPNPKPVYNISVSGPQCFLVGRHGVLVHTMCGAKGSMGLNAYGPQQGD